jgi:hypothetical protein
VMRPAFQSAVICAEFLSILALVFFI